MSLLGATILTAAATLALAVFAFITAIFAWLAFRKQSQEVAAIERQVSDEQELTRQQAELLKVQTGQLEVLRAQLAEQRKAVAAQAEVLELQAVELRESLDERKREAEGMRSAQASRVFLTLNLTPLDLRVMVTGQSPPVRLTAEIVNTSDQPAYAAQIFWPLGAMLSYAWAPNPERLGEVLPGKRTSTMREYPFDWNRDLSELAVRFTDAAGVRWLRRPEGYLGEQE